LCGDDDDDVDYDVDDVDDDVDAAVERGGWCENADDEDDASGGVEGANEKG